MERQRRAESHHAVSSTPAELLSIGGSAMVTVDPWRRRWGPHMGRAIITYRCSATIYRHQRRLEAAALRPAMDAGQAQKQP